MSFLISNSLNRKQTTTVPSTGFRLLDLPAELRLEIYDWVVPNCFLPSVCPGVYRGLFLSCTTIHDEMEQEALRNAPRELDPIQNCLDYFVTIQPPMSILHLTVNIPRWTLESKKWMNAAVKSLRALTKLNLSSLAIVLEDGPSTYDMFDLVNNLSPQEYNELVDIQDEILFDRQSGRAALDTFSRVGSDQEYYRIFTEYSKVFKLAARINCIVAPGICRKYHTNPRDRMRNCIHTTIQWRNTAQGTTQIPWSFLLPHCNTQKVILNVKKLDKDLMTDRGVYRFKGWPIVRWSPSYELPGHFDGGWRFKWYKEDKKLGLLSFQTPRSFVWYRKAKQ
jgi:hypothetical protein